MIITELLASFANPDSIQSLSFPDKLLAGLITTMLGMGITFMALIILQFIISWMEKLIRPSKEEPSTALSTKPTEKDAPEIKPPERSHDDQELVAVIASVIAMKMKTSVSNIVIKNIEKIEDRSPVWNQAGIIEQMNSRL